MFSKVLRYAMPGVLCLLLIIITIIMVNNRPVAVTGKATAATLRQEFPEPADTAVMTYTAFNHLQREKEQWKANQSLRNAGPMATSFGGWFIGLRTMAECDTCSGTRERMATPRPTKYYLQLPGYKLKDHTHTFYVAEGRNYLHYPTKEVDGYAGTFYADFVSKELPFRFAAVSLKQEFGDRKGIVLIPISGGTYKLIRIPVILLIAGLSLALLYLFFSLPVRILLRISRGEIFTLLNVQQLKWTGWVMIGLPVVVVLLQWLMKIVFNRYITNDVQLAVYDTLYSYRLVVLTGIIVLIIAKAFSRGLSLQNEQDLTI